VPTTEAEKRQLYRQGADYAIAHISSLLSRSVRLAGEWRQAKMPESVKYMAVWYQHITDPGTGLRRLNLRSDQILPNVSADVVSSLYWSLWTSEAIVREFFESSNVDAADISSRVVLHDELRSTAVQEDTEDKEESLATLYTRDDRAHHVFIASKRDQWIARGSLALAMAGDNVDGQMIQPWKRRKCKMCARSNTNINRLQQNSVPLESSSSSSSESASNAAVPLNNPTYIEGSVAWDLDDNRGCRMASVVSLIEGFRVGKFDAFELITKDGWVSDKFVAFIRSFSSMLKMHSVGTPKSGSLMSINPSFSDNASEPEEKTKRKKKTDTNVLAKKSKSSD